MYLLIITNTTFIILHIQFYKNYINKIRLLILKVITIFIYKMTLYNQLYQDGIKQTKNKNVIICGIVRDCDKNLSRNIPVIEKIASYFKNYQVVLFENNSKDKTKDILKQWEKKNTNIRVFINDFDESKYKNIPIPDGFNPAYSKRRIQKMTDYRNLYLEYIEKNNLNADYIIIVDMDVRNIDIKGVITSFGTSQQWDAIAANSHSLSPKFQKRQHDTYALIEDEKDMLPQTEKMIDENRISWASLQKNMPFIRVSSAYGGLAIYRFEAIKNLRYKIINNLAGGIEVRCEHFSLFQQMKEKGYDKIYVNPNMDILYQKTNLSFIWKKLKEKIDAQLKA